MIGILYESDEWSDWKLGHELEAALAEADRGEVRLINMEDADAVEQAMACDLLVSRVFASAAFRGHAQAHRAMEELIALAGDKDLPLINPGRAHHFEIDKRLATETLRNAGIPAPAIIAWGTPAEFNVEPGNCDDSRTVAFNREEACRASSPRVLDAGTASRKWPQPTPDQWPYPCIIKPNCGGRTTHTAVLRNPADARAFLDAAPNLVFIVEPYIKATGGFLTRIEVVDSRIALVVKRSVAASGLSSYHEGSTYELYPDCPAAVTNAVLEAARILDIQFGSFDVIEAAEGNFIIDANSVSNVSEDCTELFGFDLMAAYAQALAGRYRELRAAQASQAPRDTEP